MECDELSSYALHITGYTSDRGLNDFLLQLENEALRKHAPNRRAVEIELTPEQVEKIGIRKIGVNCGKDIVETVESISLNAL